MKTTILTLLLVCAKLFSLAQTISQAEYFIDTDKGFGKNTLQNLTPAADSSWAIHVNLTNITPGFHRLYVRVKNSNNKWCLTVRKTIEVFPTAAYPTLKKGEYFFDTDPGRGKATPIVINTADTALTLSFTANTTGLTAGYHRLYIYTQDSDGRWSISIRKSIEVIKSLDTAKITAAEYFFANDPGFGKATRKTFATPLTDGSITFTIPYNSIPASADTFFIRIVDTQLKWSLTKLSKFSGAPALLVNTTSISSKADKTSLLQFNIAIHPNPVKAQMLTLQIQHTKYANLQLGIYNLEGEIVLSQQFDVTQSTTKQININKLSAGTYVIRLSDGEEVRSVMFIKE